ncbi:MAG: ABC transporter ATP-binding protein [Flavobacteriaceae bacterium]|nr:ABC transporter ATP-binding protein [Flavobacteriaceae bacterium]
MSVILQAENISKQYRLGTVGTGTLSHDFNRWWHTVRGKEDPYLKIGEVNDQGSKATSDYVWALQDINFKVQSGEVLGIIGKNGAGKSTLLKLLSRVTAPTTGAIRTRGRIASLLEVGTGFHGELTGRENIYMNGVILGMTKKEITAKLDEIIAFSGCERYIDTPVKRYSSGMTVRLGFAVAAHLEPDILVVDEVLAVGDAEFQKKAIGKMQDISKTDGRTVLFVSHNMAAVKSLCTRGIVLEYGMKAFEGGTDDALNEYLIKISNETNEDLLKRKDRKGIGNFVIDEIKILNSHGNESSTHLSGDDVIFEIKIFNKKKLYIKDLRIDFGLNNSNDVRISWFSTSLFDKKNKFDNSDFLVIKMTILNIPLYSGLYSLTSNLIVNGQNEDWIPKAVSFKIENGDFFKTGKTIIAKQGDFLINHKFEQCK